MKISGKHIIISVGMLCFSQLANAGDCYEKVAYTVETAHCSYKFQPDVETTIEIPYSKTLEGQNYCPSSDEFRITRFNTVDFHAAFRVGGIWSYLYSSDPDLDSTLTDWIREMGHDQTWTEAESNYYSGYLTSNYVTTATRYQYVPIPCPPGSGGTPNH